MIAELTEEQKSKFGEYAEKWTKIGLNTDELPSMDILSKLINDVYTIAGLTIPNYVVLSDSPLGGVVTKNVWDNVGANVGDNVGANVGDNVRANVGANVGDNVRANVRANVRDNVGANVRDNVWDMIYGCHDADFLSFYDYFYHVCNLKKEVNELIPLVELSKSIGWWAPYENVAIIQRKPIEYHFNGNNQLHNPNNMAVKYRDGWGVYMWNGTRIPFNQSWIIDGEVNVEKIDSIENAEVRRCAIEKYTASRYVTESYYQIIDQSDWGKLLKKTMTDDEDIMMVQVKNSTPEHDGTFKDYFLRVPPTMTTAHEAIAWTFDVNAVDYNPLFES